MSLFDPVSYRLILFQALLESESFRWLHPKLMDAYSLYEKSHFDKDCWLLHLFLLANLFFLHEAWNIFYAGNFWGSHEYDDKKTIISWRTFSSTSNEL